MPRTEVTALTTLITENVVATPEQAYLLRANPHTRLMRDAVLLADGRVRVTVDRVDPRALGSAPSRTSRKLRLRLPVTFAIDPAAARAARVFVKGALIVGATLAVLAGTVWAVWAVWGDEITAAVKILLVAGGVLALVVAVGSVVTIARKGGCPGLHCPGCPHH